MSSSDSMRTFVPISPFFFTPAMVLYNHREESIEMYKDEVMKLLERLHDDSPLWKMIYTLLIKLRP